MRADMAARRGNAAGECRGRYMPMTGDEGGYGGEGREGRQENATAERA